MSIKNEALNVPASKAICLDSKYSKLGLSVWSENLSMQEVSWEFDLESYSVKGTAQGWVEDEAKESPSLQVV